MLKRFAALLLVAAINGNYSKPFVHYCTWEDCEHAGKSTFKSNWAGGYNEFTDGWCVEKTHFYNPSFSYEKCEQIIFSTFK